MVESHQRTDNKRTKEATAKGVADDGHQLIGGEWSFRKKPDFLAARSAFFNQLLEAQNAKYAALPQQAIKITLPDGNVKEGTSFKTTPLDVAAMISKQFAEKVIVAKVKYSAGKIATLDDGLSIPEELKTSGHGDAGWFDFDATRPFEGDCELKLFTFDTPEGKETFWHSSAHVLGETLELEFGVHLCHGPPTDAGFFYDSYSGKDVSVPAFDRVSEHLRQGLQGNRRLRKESR